MIAKRQKECKKCLSTILMVQEMQQLVGRLLWLLEASRKLLGIYVGRDHVVISVLSNPCKNIGSSVSKLDGYSV
jgi:hypothetical protein